MDNQTSNNNKINKNNQIPPMNNSSSSSAVTDTLEDAYEYVRAQGGFLLNFKLKIILKNQVY